MKRNIIIAIIAIFIILLLVPTPRIYTGDFACDCIPEQDCDCPQKGDVYWDQSVVSMVYQSFTAKSLQMQNIALATDDDRYTLYLKYIGSDKWTYEIKGNAPNPCYKVEHKYYIGESSPPSINVRIIETKPIETVMCAQVLQPIFFEGTIEAPKNAEFNIGVDQKW